MSDVILTLNAGSSSLKFALFETAGPRPLASGMIEGIGENPRLKSGPAERPLSGSTHEALLGAVLDWADERLGDGRLVAAVHRIVHGGTQFRAPVRLTPDVLAALAALNPLAPLHQPHNLAAVAALAAHRPGLVQIGCFDTAFHAGLGSMARRFALPPEYERQGVRRYGFHGLSYEYIAGRLKDLAPDKAHKRIIIAHLGSGASLCAIKNGVSIDTTMGFSPLDGLVMATRCGALDPGVPLYLMRSGLDAGALEDLLYRRSGLLGVSGLSGDMRVLLASPSAQAQEAIDLFVFHILREIGALTAGLGGLDGLVFTAGIGENAAEIRRRVVQGCDWLGAALDDNANEANAPRIDGPKSDIALWVIPTDEEMMMARHAITLI